jgi:hypothetical protein
MVQAFENPTENPNNGRAVPKNTPEIAVPSPIDGPDQEGKYGSALRLPQARRLGTSTSSAAGFKPFGDPDKVNQFWRI